MNTHCSPRSHSCLLHTCPCKLDFDSIRDPCLVSSRPLHPKTQPPHPPSPPLLLCPCRLDFDSIQISQGLVCAIAELMQLTSLQLLHGSIAPGLVLAHWSSLKQLAELTLLPAEQAGLGDAQVHGGCSCMLV